MRLWTRGRPPTHLTDIQSGLAVGLWRSLVSASSDRLPVSTPMSSPWSADGEVRDRGRLRDRVWQRAQRPGVRDSRCGRSELLRHEVARCEWALVKEDRRMPKT